MNKSLADKATEAMYRARGLEPPAPKSASPAAEDVNRGRSPLAERLSLPALKNLTPEGAEIPDPVPMSPPVGWFKQPSMVDNIRNLVAQELSRRAQDQGFESFEEAEDFDVDDLDPTSPYEDTFDPPINGLSEPSSPPPATPLADPPPASVNPSEES